MGVSLYFAAPEVLFDRISERADPLAVRATDLYSFSIVLFYMLMRAHPWSEYQGKDEFLEAVRQGKRPTPLPAFMAAKERDPLLGAMFHVMTECWSEDPMRRLTASAALRFLANVDGVDGLDTTINITTLPVRQNPSATENIFGQLGRAMGVIQK